MAARDRIDLDRMVDYRAEYSAVIENAHVHGTSLTGRCPFHQDRKDSFSVDLETGKWHCFTEDIGGNFVSFWAKYYGVDNKTAYQQILERYGVSQDKPKDVKKKDGNANLEPYTLEQYSRDKGLPADFLTDVCAVTTGERHGVAFLRIAYLRADGGKAVYRERYGNKEFRWAYGARGNLCLYGDWRLPEFREQGWIVLVEGESDTQSLWYMGFPGIGVPGASNFKPEYGERLREYDIKKIYLHKEPDMGGEKFVEKVCRALADAGYPGEVYLWDCDSLGTKDPSDLYIKHGREEARNRIWDTFQALTPVDLSKHAFPEAIPGAPVNLRTPGKWMYSEDGIFRMSDNGPVMVCRTPIILTKRLENIVTREEKIEVAFKRDGRWISAAYERDMIFRSQNITILSKLGCTITSENAKKVVAFLGDLEAENIDRIPKVESTSVYGWQPGNRFLPGYDEGIALDVDPSMAGIAAGYCQSGTFEDWIELMRPHREREKFRFLLAASFAAPLLRIVKQRIFLVHNWGDSKGGKTAALKAALSAWGDPERLMVNFNATTVGLERTAEFFCDLPLGVDERQLAGKHQDLGQQIYMLASGKGKTRGSKTGGLQLTRQWRTVALTTGEEPLSTETTQTGISTRTLELYGGPFDNETDASRMHQRTAEVYGWAGPAFIRKLLQIPEGKIVELYGAMREYAESVSGGKNGSHIAGVSLVALADALIDRWFFGGTWAEAWTKAQQMAENILVNQVEANATDVNENAVQFLVDWVLSNRACFMGGEIGPDYGHFDISGNTVYILPSVFNQALEKAGFSSPQKVKNYMAENGLIRTSEEKRGEKTVKRLTVKQWHKGRATQFVEFFIGKISEKVDETNDAAEYRDHAPPPQEWRQQDISELRDGNHSDMPF